MLVVRPPAHGSTMTTTTSNESSVQAHLDAVGRLYAAYAAGDLDRVLDELTDDVDWAAEAAGTSVPWYGPHRGKADVPRFFEAIASNIDISGFEIVGMTASETDVVATIHWTFTVKATQRSATMYMQHWWRFADGKIAFFRGSEDSGQTIAAFQGA
jgi:ketosteroid isomerase-like protein